MVVVYRRPNGFINATAIAPGNYVNTDPGQGSGIDTAIAGNFQQGICAGLAAAWIMAFASGAEDARDTANFESYFNNMLRFQGAYLMNYKGKQGISTTTQGMDPFIRPVQDLGVGVGIHRHSSHEVRLVGENVLPAGNFAGYTVVPGHAIGMGRHGGTCYIMDPNYGLQSYDDIVNFIVDLNYLYGAYRQRFNCIGSTVQLYFYKQGNRARADAFSA
ncbi:hypothetical protein [Algicella marina]|uniref:Peptidase C58 YopT-type domain-containing protein n=1 Tax=Algicella marina TaxID=2683284 RepID=A0A6P1T5Q0_9RHOB|nr:hypothetical protein [Algicella marina]QHQ37020.1 hypothetical protein GO499_18440 [Algicella marina]